MPETAQQVAHAIAEARRLNLDVVVQATGHNAGPLGAVDDALLINTSRLTGWEIDAHARRVRVGAATKWEVVTPALSELGLKAYTVLTTMSASSATPSAAASAG